MNIGKDIKLLEAHKQQQKRKEQIMKGKQGDKQKNQTEHSKTKNVLIKIKNSLELGKFEYGVGIKLIIKELF